MDDPTRHLVEPSPPDDSVGNGYVNPTAILDYASPTAWLNSAIEGLTDFDVLGTLVQPLAGDWERIGKYGDALKHMSECLGEMAVQTQSHASELTASWHGNASDSAFQYFSSTSTAMSRYADLLVHAAQQYKALALGVWQVAESLKGILQNLCDQALVALIEIAAGTALAETGVGAVVGYSLAALQIMKIVDTIADAGKKIQIAWIAIDLFFSTLLGVFKEFGDLGSIPTPTIAYHHPMVS
ncbi:hypothetical protein AB0H43_12470 [Hamadaea sp. NPDC050747]|uniref:hypothetical protein n=1 Tax=Hamadaea sp. NPDC050747 TaxID=3155789 RepID=UPI0033FB2DE1